MKFLCLLLLLVPCITSDSVLVTSILNKFLTFVKFDNASSTLFAEGFEGKRYINGPHHGVIRLEPDTVPIIFSEVPESLRAGEIFELSSAERTLENDDALRIQTWLLNKQAYFNFIFNWKDVFQVAHLDFVTPNITFSFV